MRIFGLRIGRVKISDIISDINKSLPAELDKEQYLVDRFRPLVILLGSERQKEVETILSTEKEFLSGEILGYGLKPKFQNLRNYPFYRDFLKDKDSTKFMENVREFRRNQDLNLSDEEIKNLGAYVEKELAMVNVLREYFLQLDYSLKSISVPLKLLKRRGIKLRNLYIELGEHLKSDSNQKYLKKFKKGDIDILNKTLNKRLNEFYYLDKIIASIDEQRILTRRAKHLSFNLRNSEAIACIQNIKKIVAGTLSDENRRIYSFLTDEQQFPISETDVKLVLRRNKLRLLRNSMIAVCAIYSVYGVGMTFSLSTFAFLPTAHTYAVQNVNIAKQDIEIPSEFGKTPAWFFKSNNSDKIVVIAHPLNHNKTYEIPLIQELMKKGYNAITFDFPGHGENPLKFGTVSYGINETKVVLEVLDFIEKQGFKEAVLVGQSMGAVSSLKAAANYNGSLQIKGVVADAAYSNAKDSFHHVGKYVLGIVDPLTDIGTYLGGLTGGVDYNTLDLTKDVTRIKSPTFYQWGELDELLPKSVIEPLKAIAQDKGDSVKVYKGESHVNFNSPYRIGDVVKFVSEHMLPN